MSEKANQAKKRQRKKEDETHTHTFSWKGTETTRLHQANASCGISSCTSSSLFFSLCVTDDFTELHKSLFPFAYWLLCFIICLSVCHTIHGRRLHTLLPAVTLTVCVVSGWSVTSVWHHRVAHTLSLRLRKGNKETHTLTCHFQNRVQCFEKSGKAGVCEAFQYSHPEMSGRHVGHKEEWRLF